MNYTSVLWWWTFKTYGHFDHEVSASVENIFTYVPPPHAYGDNTRSFLFIFFLGWGRDFCLPVRCGFVWNWKISRWTVWTSRSNGPACRRSLCTRALCLRSNCSAVTTFGTDHTRNSRLVWHTGRPYKSCASSNNQTSATLRN